MRKINRKPFILLFSFIASSAPGTSSDHLLALKSRFPYGLLGDDYGILTMSDLAINTCHSKPHPFPPEDRITPYEYWQCFESKNISLNCISGGFEDGHDGIGGLLAIRVSAARNKHEFIERRPWPIKECTDFLKSLSVILKGTAHACISGSFIEEENDTAGNKASSWFFERLKTSTGCEGRGCHFTKKTHQECPELKSYRPKNGSTTN